MAFKISVDPIQLQAPVDPQMAAKHFDIVLGLDFHVLKVPWPITPCPITPFAALVFDPMDYIHCTIPAMPVYDEKAGFTLAKNVPMGGTVLINDMYRGAAQGALWGLPSVPPMMGKLKGLGKIVSKLNLLHSVIPHPLFLLPKFFHPHEGQLSHGSPTVITQGMWQSTFLCRAYSCQDAGKILMNNPTGGFYLNFLTAVMTVLPLGKPVLVGGAKQEQQLKLADLLNSLMFMGIMHGFKFALKMLGKLLTKLLAKIEGKFPGFSKFRAKVQPFICKYLGEPVDAASGHMASYLEGFTLPGPIPFCWEANYYSDSNYDGPLGKNIYHSYDITLLVDEVDDLVVMNDTAGRPVLFPTLRPGDSFYNPKEKYELHRGADGQYFVSHKDGLYYYFNAPLPGSNGHGSLRSIANRNGFAIRFAYNAKGSLQQITDSAGRIITVVTDAEGRIAQLRLPHPVVGESGVSFAAVTYTYDADGCMATLQNAEGFSNKLVWQGRYIIARTFNNGVTFTFAYDKQGRCTAALGPDGLFSYTFAYAEGYTIATNSLGHKKTYYHHNGIVTKIVNSLGGEQLFTYDEYDNLVAESNEIGLARTYTYDDRGNLATIALLGQGEVSIEYNTLNKPVKTTLPNGGIWTYTYDEAGNLLARTDPQGAQTAYTYSNGLLHTITNALGSATRLYYDRQYNLSRVALPNDTELLYSYDSQGCCTSLTDPAGATQYRTYNLLGEVVRIEEADGSKTEIQYDSMGNAVYAADKHSKVNLWYNFFGQVTRRRQGADTLYFGYDKEGQLRSVTNEHQEQYRFELDSEGHVITETGFDGLTRHYLRNAAGQVVQVRRPNGHTDAYEYSPSGKITTVLHEADGSSEQYEYDSMGSLVKAVNAEAEIVLKRNVMGRIVKENCNGKWVESSFNSLGQRTHLQSSLGADLAIGYNNLMGWAESMEANGWQAQMQHNEYGQETLRQLNGGVQQKSDYDGAGRLIQQSILGENKRLKHYRQYSWDGDRLTGIKDTATGDKVFKHDVHGNLSEVIYGDGTVEFRMPDAVGNLFESRERKDRKYAKGGRLTESKTARYKYDEEGNLIEKRERNGREWFYHWNEAGMLIKVVRPDFAEVTFGYDALGRRIWKKYKSTITKWVWDSDKPLHEWKEHALTGAILSDTSVDSDGIITWLFEEDNFSPIAKLKGDKKYSITTDHLGTPSHMYAEDSKLCWQGELDSYGRMRMELGETGSCPFRYQGQYEDKETSLYYNRFRYYSPDEGIYISKDPIGLFGGYNVYSYVINSNVLVDPFGLAATYCAKSKRWRDTETGRYRKKPTDLSDLVHNGKIDYPSLMEFKNGMADWNTANPHDQWSAAPGKFPSGGFKHDLKNSSGVRHKMHGHGPNPDAPLGSNAISNPTTTIRRSGGDALTTNGTWTPASTANPNDIHIPLINSPF